MMTLTKLAVCFPLLLFDQAMGHGYLMEPKSRNYYASTDGSWWCTTNCGNIPKMEDTPHGMNGNSVCGIKQTDASVNYNFPKNYYGEPLAWKTQSTYQNGAVITIKIAMSSFHLGHFELYACPRSQSPTQECFNKYPLQFVSDLLYGAVKDNDYPMRAYASPSPTSFQNGLMIFEYTMKLPSDVSGDALIQWIYVTANSCSPPGYDKYPFPWTGAYNKWLSPCVPSNERFWNCAEVNIVGANTKSPELSPTKKPTKFPLTTLTKKPSKRPIKTPTRKPSKRPTRKPTKRPTRKPTKRPIKTTPTRKPTKRPIRLQTAIQEDACCTAGVTMNMAAKDCKGYFTCISGVNQGYVSCPSGTLFNQINKVCDLETNVNCVSSCALNRHLRGDREKQM